MSKFSLFRKSIKPIIILSNFSLLNASYLNKSLQYNEKSYKIFIFLKVLIIILVLWAYGKILIFQSLQWPSSVANIIGQCNFAMITISYLFISVQNLQKNSKYNMLIETFEKLDKKMNLPKRYYNVTQRQIKYFIVYLISSYIFIIVEKLFNGLDQSKYFYYPLEFYVVFCIPLFPSSVCMLNAMVFVSMIQVRLEYISEKLRLIKWNNEFNSNLTLTFLRDMCVLHMKLNDITLLINEVFGISIMANVAMYFVQFVCGGYTMVFAFKSITDTTEMYQLCLTSIIYNYPYLPLFFWICYCCRCTIQEVI